MEVLLYQEIFKVDELNLTQMLGSTDEKEVINALLALVLYGENDWQYNQRICMNFLENKVLAIASIAVICLGHIARNHSCLDKRKAIDALKCKANNFPKLAGTIKDALENINLYKIIFVSIKAIIF
ncbi:hypothetical protein [Alkanindiges illinoisensis]|uniref:hypothetical protein n=1 Tax=Alkanindiges illinoisensis TaxID=197183 RepID=UPI0012EC111B|nr:hypothetical protein [Alkanindiges illinoisensis]